MWHVQAVTCAGSCLQQLEFWHINRYMASVSMQRYLCLDTDVVSMSGCQTLSLLHDSCRDGHLSDNLAYSRSCIHEPAPTNPDRHLRHQPTVATHTHGTGCAKCGICCTVNQAALQAQCLLTPTTQEMPQLSCSFQNQREDTNLVRHHNTSFTRYQLVSHPQRAPRLPPSSTDNNHSIQARTRSPSPPPQYPPPST
jgi:hypothetical protein